MSDLEHVVGIRLRNAGKISYYHSGGMRLEVGEHVVVESARGPELGRVVISPGQVVVNELGDDLPPILRLANDTDVRRYDALARDGEELLPKARALAAEVGFPGHIEKTEFTLDRKRLTLSFSSEERIEYRELIRAAGDRFGVRAEARQLGSRDRARLAGGYGICGRELCCSSWLNSFPSISIRMAKEQDLPLNPQKISGLCGRLLCCLSYEEQGYKEMRKTLPKVGQRCSTPSGEGKVIAVNTLLRQVTLIVSGQRVEVRDRDLGTVVRWDPSSRAADPPPSITRQEGIDQGLIEDTGEEEPDEAAGEWEPVDFGPGRGRLPGGGPRRVVKPKPERTEPAAAAPAQPEQKQGRSRRRGSGRTGEQSPPDVDAARSRTFRRSTAPKPSPADPPAAAAGQPQPQDGSGGQGTSSRRRGRRGGRGRRSGGGNPGGSQPTGE